MKTCARRIVAFLGDGEGAAGAARRDGGMRETRRRRKHSEGGGQDAAASDVAVWRTLAHFDEQAGALAGDDVGRDEVEAVL
jgi:hypothetical protein